MDKVHMLEDLQQRIAALFSSSPAADVQKNLKALLMQQFARLELVTQEEFELQRQVLARTREKLEALEARVVQLVAAHDCAGLGGDPKRHLVDHAAPFVLVDQTQALAAALVCRDLGGHAYGRLPQPPA